MNLGTELDEIHPLNTTLCDEALESFECLSPTFQQRILQYQHFLSLTKDYLSSYEPPEDDPILSNYVLQLVDAVIRIEVWSIINIITTSHQLSPVLTPFSPLLVGSIPSLIGPPSFSLTLSHVTSIATPSPLVSLYSLPNFQFVALTKTGFKLCFGGSPISLVSSQKEKQSKTSISAIKPLKKSTKVLQKVSKLMSQQYSIPCFYFFENNSESVFDKVFPFMAKK
ncbi:hypothetical protein RCL1_003562 [Eukaryota sp. TZLM3-RCL]